MNSPFLSAVAEETDSTLCSMRIRFGNIGSTGKFWWTNAAWPSGVPPLRRISVNKNSRIRRRTSDPDGAIEARLVVLGGRVTKVYRAVDALAIADGNPIAQVREWCQTGGRSALKGVRPEAVPSC